MNALIPKRYKDDEIEGASTSLPRFAEKTGVQQMTMRSGQETLRHLTQWLSSVAGREGIAVKPHYETSLEYYWVLLGPYYWLFLLFLPVEVLVRRWHLLFER